MGVGVRLDGMVAFCRSFSQTRWNGCFFFLVVKSCYVSNKGNDISVKYRSSVEEFEK